MLEQECMMCTQLKIAYSEGSKIKAAICPHLYIAIHCN